MKYIYLTLAIVFEIAGTSAMKYSMGFQKFIPSALTALFYVLSLVFLGSSLRYFEVGKVYAVWSGVGIASIAIIGHFLFNESMTIDKIVFISLIILGVVGLNLTGNHL